MQRAIELAISDLHGKIKATAPEKAKPNRDSMTLYGMVLA
jgi:hypothetical protein